MSCVKPLEYFLTCGKHGVRVRCGDDGDDDDDDDDDAIASSSLDPPAEITTSGYTVFS